MDDIINEFLNADYPDENTEVRIVVKEDGGILAFCNDVSAVIKILMPNQTVYTFEFPDTQV